MSKKYELTDKTKVVAGHTLHRIRALKDFGNVKAGDLGGFVENETNLSHNGICWVYGNAKVYGNAWFYGNAKVYGYTEVYGDAIVCGNTKVCDTAEVHGDVKLSEGIVNCDADVC